MSSVRSGASICHRHRRLIGPGLGLFGRGSAYVGTDLGSFVLLCVSREGVIGWIDDGWLDRWVNLHVLIMPRFTERTVGSFELLHLALEACWPCCRSRARIELDLKNQNVQIPIKLFYCLHVRTLEKRIQKLLCIHCWLSHNSGKSKSDERLNARLVLQYLSSIGVSLPSQACYLCRSSYSKEQRILGAEVSKS